MLNNVVIFYYLSVVIYDEKLMLAQSGCFGNVVLKTSTAHITSICIDHKTPTQSVFASYKVVGGRFGSV